LSYSDYEISPTGALSCDFTLSSPTKEPSRKSVSLFPNPGSGELRMNGLPPGNNKVQVRDPLGRTVLLGTRIANDAPIETTGWAKGTYFIEVTGADGTRQVLRWVKE